MKRTVIVTFVPQVWVGDYAMEVPPPGDATWEVTAEDIAGIRPGTYESDELRNHPNAPEWCAEWPGPFECSFDPDLT